MNFPDSNDAVTRGVIFTEFIIIQKLKQLKSCREVKKKFIMIAYPALKEYLIWQKKTGILHL